MKIGILNTVLALLTSAGVAFSQSESPVATLDAFFEQSGTGQGVDPQLFTDGALCNSIIYAEDGSNSIFSFSMKEYLAQLDSLEKSFDLHHEPVVLLSRSYGAMASFFCSVYTRLIDLETKDTLRLRSIQSFHLVYDRGWKINHLAIQNEVSAFPLGADLWPTQLTGSIPIGVKSGIGSDSNMLYDPGVVFTQAEVNLAPEYPRDKELMAMLMDAYGVVLTQSEGAAPFEVLIAEDGFASLHSADALDDEQVKQATSFVQSMLVWYPAVLDEASVKCIITFYIQ